ncbi:MAG: biotin--[acetyl-CoA-carboxylase] ligase [Weizmannia coagulans]|uniref:Bifunctional ligase/repressor BirA n=1 Tax=Heyndrickxia coagulans 36D1 TaxID=345219 RepID=G2TM92_HEYCO|nr:MULTISPECIES: biotin--[acetyl-CoA-carboxylase] ligase [Heyndrickxia]NWN95577.1 biotin--[acetyl-CoA-carboxylase] ligase [Bacillus sp. (in: firmicutes)]AEP02159.1 biotin/acetyl-CoA-carboxylase ligase [Heyndrickxia coagulans 36D1]APB36273.1 biotin--[acetyl-CoA-carboxylase] ligase [Heyndrickxia coagulans]AVD56274.1 biotin--[acetyl-CoA-carboxylase] ligase [Heyndrickxia coagulans]KGT40297.1 biotin--acetyl-CoA-carboxylase ligase [Heyndrickxia coagulans P38]
MQISTREKIIELLTEAGDGFVSGETLAKKLNCSRAAVWKHMEELRKEGFELEAVRKKGYRIKGTGDKVTENEIRYGLGTKRLARNIHYRETIDSTQRLAHQLVQEGCPDGTLVIAEQQTGGRGRLRRSWYSPKYTGIWMSIVLRPDLPPQMAPPFTLIAAVAVAQAIEETAGIVPEIKWPNDLLIGGKKCAGILTELEADTDRIQAVITGIGINVNETDFPDPLKSIATSLSLASGKKVKRALLIQRILEKLEKYEEIYLQNGFAPLKILWESYANVAGKKITAHTLKGDISGRAVGITDDGVLQLEGEDGQMHAIYSADIEIER